MDLATIGLKVDSSGVVRAIGDLDDLAAAGSRAEVSTESLGKESSNTSTKLKGMAGSASGAAAATDKLQNAQRTGARQFNQYGLSVKQQAAAMRLLPAQITDIVTSLVSGQPAYLVAIQQGGQLKDSFGGIKPAAQALLGVFNPLNIGIGLVGGAAIAAAAGFLKGQQESNELRKSLILTGGSAGVTAGQLEMMAVELDRIGGTRAKAAATLAALVSTGRVGGENMEYFAETAIAAERTLGLATEDTIKQFAELGKEPVSASLKLNDSMHYLTLSTYAQIRALEEEGKQIDAARLAQDSFANALSGRTTEMETNLGYIEKAWLKIKDAVKETGDSILAVGRPGNGPDFGWLQNLLPSLAQGGPAAAFGAAQAFSGGGVSASSIAMEQERNDKLAQAGIRASEEIQRWREASLTTEQKLNRELEKYRRNLEAIRAADAVRPAGTAALAPSGEQRAAQIRAIRETFNSSKPVSMLGFDVDAIKRDLRAMTDANANAERVLDAQRSMGLVSAEDYYSAKQGFIERDAQLQTDAISAEIARLQSEKAAGQDKIDLETRIADAVQQRAMVQTKATTDAILLDQQQKAEADRLIRSYQQTQIAAQEYLNTLSRGYQRELDDFGQGPAARRYSAGRNDIDDNTSRQRMQLEGQRAAGQIGGAEYTQQLESINQFHQQAIAQWDTYYTAIEERQRDFGLGFQESFLEYADSMKNVGATLGGNLISALDTAKNSAYDLAAANALWGESGSEAAKQIARDVIQKLVASMIQAGVEATAMYALQKAGILTTTALSVAASQTTAHAQSVANAQIASSAAPAAGLTSLATGGGNAITAAIGIGVVSAAIGAMLGGAFAEGGRPPTGKVSLIGEKGPELWVPDGPGTIIPNGSFGRAAINQQSANVRGDGPINIHNYAGVSVQAQRRSDGEIEILIRQAEERAVTRSRQQVSADLRNGEGVATAFESSYGMRRKGNRSGS